MFSKVIEINNWIGERMGGRVVEPARSGMPADGTILYGGGQVTDQFILALETKVYEGQAASAALALNRMATAPEPPLRRSSTDRSRNLDERLRRLGIGVADR